MWLFILSSKVWFGLLALSIISCRRGGVVMTVAAELAPGCSFPVGCYCWNITRVLWAVLGRTAVIPLQSSVRKLPSHGRPGAKVTVRLGVGSAGPASSSSCHRGGNRPRGVGSSDSCSCYALVEKVLPLSWVEWKSPSDRNEATCWASRVRTRWQVCISSPPP